LRKTDSAAVCGGVVEQMVFYYISEKISTEK